MKRSKRILGTGFGFGSGLVSRLTWRRVKSNDRCDTEAADELATGAHSFCPRHPAKIQGAELFEKTLDLNSPA